MIDNRHRRRFLTKAVVASAMVALPGLAARAATGLIVTPQQTRGPFYPRKVPLDSDNDLTRIEGRSGQAKGIVTDIAGRVVDERGRPVRGARVEIWQCDANGRYRHPGDRSRTRLLDDNFQGYGQLITDSDGAYRFRTIKPVSYPGRTPHIHFSVSGGGFEAISTQMYVEGESGNREDGVYNSLRSDRLRDSVTVALRETAFDSAELEGMFDIVLAAHRP